MKSPTFDESVETVDVRRVVVRVSKAHDGGSLVALVDAYLWGATGGDCRTIGVDDDVRFDAVMDVGQFVAFREWWWERDNSDVGRDRADPEDSPTQDVDPAPVAPPGRSAIRRGTVRLTCGGVTANHAVGDEPYTGILTSGTGENAEFEWVPEAMPTDLPEPSPPRRTIRVPASGQRVTLHMRPMTPPEWKLTGCVDWIEVRRGGVVVRVRGDGDSFATPGAPEDVTPVGPEESHRWITIELPPESPESTEAR